MKHPVFIPKPRMFASRTIAQGSAIVGKKHESDGFIIFYEGNLYHAENIKTFEDKAMLAAGRMEDNYPTVAKMLCRKEDLILVGHFESSDKSLVILDDEESAEAFSA